MAITQDTEPADSFRLYCYYSSSCCHRVVIAAHLKSIPLTVSVPNLKDEPQRDEYRNALNPIASVPTLIVTSASGRKTRIRQSVAILEYFEERFPHRYPLLPPVSEPEQRARVRDFVNIITSDVQPPANSRGAQRVRAIRGELDDQVAFVKSVRTGLPLLIGVQPIC